MISPCIKCAIACIVLINLISFGYGNTPDGEPHIIETGIASWYTSDDTNALTANGEQFDPDAIAAAHKTLKFGTIVRVHNLLNEKYVDVRIFDRGPYVEGRIIDLTPAAANIIDLLEVGIAPVTLELLYEPTYPDSRYDRPGDTGWYKLQVGSFSHAASAYALYRLLVENSFKVGIEIVDTSVIRVSVRWIEEDMLEDTQEKLSELGCNDILLRSEVPPSP